MGIAAEQAVAVEDVTKDYGNGRGNFDMAFNVAKGESFGLVGENGAGKTTIIRQIMGFVRPSSGRITVWGMDAYKDAVYTKRHIGYVPGEINLPDLRTGRDFLESQADMKGLADFRDVDTMLERLQLDIRAYPKRMSKGMKQKTAIVAALMGHPDLIIMDEPTTGLDPLMRDEFLKIVAEEKQRGATILMSSNTYEELEAVCDEVALISKGKIIDLADVNAIRGRAFRDYKIEFKDADDYHNFINEKFEIIRLQQNYLQVTIRVKKEDIQKLLDDLGQRSLKFISEEPYDLDSYFAARRME